jgi:hypothetical protein
MNSIIKEQERRFSYTSMLSDPCYYLSGTIATMDSMYPEQQNRQQDLFINIQRPHHPYYNQHDDLIFNHRPVSPISPPLTLKEEAGHLEKRPIRSRGRRVSSIPGPGTRMFTCNADGCGKVFKRSEHLKRHIRSIHTLEKRN